MVESGTGERGWEMGGVERCEGFGDVSGQGQRNVKREGLESPTRRRSGRAEGVVEDLVFCLNTPLAGRAVEKGIGRVQCSLVGKEGWGMRKVVWCRPRGFGGRRGKGWWGCGTEEKGVSEMAKSPKMVNGERKEGDVIGVEVGYQQGCVDLGCASNKLLSDALVVCNMKRVRRWELRRQGNRKGSWCRRNGNVDGDIAGCDGRVRGRSRRERREPNVCGAFGRVVREYCRGFALDIRVVATEVGKGSKSMKDGVKGIADAVRKGGFVIFSACKEVVAETIHGFATGARGW